MRPKSQASALVSVLLNLSLKVSTLKIYTSGVVKNSAKKYGRSFLQWLLLLIVFNMFAISSFGANRYWVTGGTGVWNSTTNWSATSGGSSGATVPTNVDLAIFDANSGSPTVTFSAAPGTISQLWITGNTSVTFSAIAANRTLTVGNNTANSITGASVANADLVIESGSTLNISVPAAANNMIVAQNNNANSAAVVIGKVQVNTSGSITKAANPTFNFNSGSLYVHNRDGGTIPVGVTWANTSTCQITGITGTNMSSILADPGFGNFIFDCPGLTFSPRLTGNTALTFTIKGNMDILRTNGRSLDFTNNDALKTLQINGNLTVGDGVNNTLFTFNSGGADNVTVNLGGNLNVLANATLRNTAASSTVNFGFGAALATPSVTWGGGGTYTNSRINYVIQNVPAGKTVNLIGFSTNTITIPAGQSLTVNSGATLNCGTQVVAGTGSFILSTGGKLGIGHVNGINGNLTTTTQTLNANGAGTTFIYNGTATQVTGSNLPLTVNNLTINNSTGVTLSANLTASNTLTMTQGNVTTGAFTLALSNGLVGSLTRVSGTVIGKIRRTVSTTLLTDYAFPVGTAGFYRPAIMNFSALSAGTNITAEFIANPPGVLVPYTDATANLSNTFTEGFWRFSSSTVPAATYSLDLTGNGFTSYTLNEVTRITGRDNGNTTWRGLGSHGTQTGNDITRTGVTNLNSTYFDFALAASCTPVSMGYNYERDIIVDFTKVEGGSDLSNYPLLINLTGQTFLKPSPTGRILNVNCYDLIFTDDNYNKLDHQLEYYNGTNGDLIAWVRIPTLSSSSNTTIKVLYGNPLITVNPSVTSVWDSHYKGVWHLDDNSLNDFTSFNKSGTPFNTPAYPVGNIYNSLGLSGSNQYVEVTNAPNTNFNGNLTVSAWIKINTGGLDQKIAGNQTGVAGGYKFGVYTTNLVEFEIRDAANNPFLNRGVAGGTVLNTGQWYYVAGMSSDVLDSIRTFVSGIPERPFKKTGTLIASSDNLTIGKEPWTATAFFDGSIDELRISDEVRSNGWLRTDYNNQSSPSSFYSLGAEVLSNHLPVIRDLRRANNTHIWISFWRYLFRRPQYCW